MFGLCVGKKTALLQAVALACMSGLVNVQLCALALHYFVFFQSLSSKLSVRVCLFTLTANVPRVCAVAKQWHIHAVSSSIYSIIFFNSSTK